MQYVFGGFSYLIRLLGYAQESKVDIIKVLSVSEFLNVIQYLFLEDEGMVNLSVLQLVRDLSYIGNVGNLAILVVGIMHVYFTFTNTRSVLLTLVAILILVAISFQTAQFMRISAIVAGIANAVLSDSVAVMVFSFLYSAIILRHYVKYMRADVGA